MAEDKYDKSDDRKPVDNSLEEERCAKMVLACKKQSVDFYEDRFSKFNYFDRLYIKGACKKNAPYGRSNLKLPLVFQQVEPFVAQMTETMCGEGPYIRYQGRTTEDDESAEKITDFTQWQLEAGGFLKPQTQWFRNLAKYGTAIMKPVWEVEVEEVEEEQQIQLPAFDPITQSATLETVTQKVTETVIVHDGPRFYNVSIYDFFVPASATSSDVQRLDWCIHRNYLDLDQMIDNPNYINKDKLKKIRGDSEDEDGNDKSDGPSFERDTGKKTQIEQNTDKPTEKFAGKHEVLEWWGYYGEKKGDEKVPYLITVALIQGAADPIILRKEKNPFKYKFKPFIACNDYPIEGEFYGYGEVDHIEGLVTESTALRNHRLDVNNMSLNKMWLVERQAGVNLRDLYAAPNKIVLTNDLNGLRQLEFSGITQASVEELGKIDFDIQNTTEIINPRQDVSSVGAAFGGTATGVNFLSARANLRLLLKARIIEQDYFKPLGMMLLKYNRDMVTDETYFRATDEKENPYGHQIGPDAFASEIDYKATSNPSKLSVDERKANLGYLLQTIAQVEKVAPGSTNFYELLPEVFKTAGFTHPDKYVNPQQTTIMVTPDGQAVDRYGKPVQIMQVDEKGQPIQQAQPQVA